MRAFLLNGNSYDFFLRSMVRSCNTLTLGSIWNPLKSRNPIEMVGLSRHKSMSTNMLVIRVKEKINLIENENMIFDRLPATVRHFDLPI